MPEEGRTPRTGDDNWTAVNPQDEWPMLVRCARGVRSTAVNPVQLERNEPPMLVRCARGVRLKVKNRPSRA